MMKTREFHVTAVTNDAWIGGRKVMSTSRKARTPPLSRQTSGCIKNFLLTLKWSSTDTRARVIAE